MLYRGIFLRVLQYFDDPGGQVKIQIASKNVQRYYTLKCLIRDLLSNVFLFRNPDITAFEYNFRRAVNFISIKIKDARQVHLDETKKVNLVKKSS